MADDLRSLIETANAPIFGIDSRSCGLRLPCEFHNVLVRLQALLSKSQTQAVSLSGIERPITGLSCCKVLLPCGVAGLLVSASKLDTKRRQAEQITSYPKTDRKGKGWRDRHLHAAGSAVSG